MQLTYNKLLNIESQLGDSFYILKTEELKKNIKEFEFAFRQEYKNSIVCYSYKTNYIPFVCKIVDELGAYAEIVSEMELEIAKQLLIDPLKIVYNGPIKSRTSLEYCLLNNSIINIDNLSELELIHEIIQEYPNKEFKVGMRINIDLDDGFFSRFGFDINTNEFSKAIDIINSTINLKLVGFHSHSTRPDKNISSYIKRLDLLVKYAKTFISINDLEYIDIGGGYYGKMDNEIKKQFNISDIPSFNDYGLAIGSRMKEYFPNENVILYIEPGLAMTVNILDFVCKVKNVKSIQQKNIVTCSGSFHNVKPSGHKKNITMDVFTDSSDKNAAEKEYDICGYTCLENDIINYKHKAVINKNDFLVFKNVGAYTIVFKPSFIKLAPPIIAFENNEMLVIRKKEEFNDIFNSFMFI